MGRTTRTVHVSECAQGAASPRAEIAGAKCARTFIVAGRQYIVLVVWPFGGLSLMVVIPAGVAMRSIHLGRNRSVCLCNSAANFPFGEMPLREAVRSDCH